MNQNIEDLKSEIKNITGLEMSDNEILGLITSIRFRVLEQEKGLIMISSNPTVFPVRYYKHVEDE